MAILVMHDDSLERKTWALNEADFTIGRSAECALVLDGRFISRKHAVLKREGECYSLVDLSSKNGTWVNKERVGSRPRTLQDGDIIHLGDLTTALRFLDGDSTVTAIDNDYIAPPPKGVYLNLAKREVYVDGQLIEKQPTTKEFDILALLWRKRLSACARDEIAAHGWPERPDGDVSHEEIDQYIKRLRERIGKGRKSIETLRRFGYKLVYVPEAFSDR